MYVLCGDIKSNTITITVEDKAALAEKEAQEKAETEAAKKAEEEAAKKAEEEAAKKAKEEAAKKAEEEAAKKAEEERKAAEAPPKKRGGTDSSGSCPLKNLRRQIKSHKNKWYGFHKAEVNITVIRRAVA